VDARKIRVVELAVGGAIDARALYELTLAVR
jgi:hypothetical protein